jgi:hypothetical protein
MPPNKLGCDGVADMYLRVCEAAEQVLADPRPRGHDDRPPGEARQAGRRPDRQGG